MDKRKDKMVIRAVKKKGRRKKGKPGLDAVKEVDMSKGYAAPAQRF